MTHKLVTITVMDKASVALVIGLITITHCCSKLHSDNSYNNDTKGSGKLSVSEYYSSVDLNAIDDDLKYQLKALINPHTVLTYDDVWDAFPLVDVNLPTYPCSSNLTYIPDVYSGYCWDPEKLSSTGGECGNYKQEGQFIMTIQYI